MHSHLRVYKLNGSDQTSAITKTYFKIHVYTKKSAVLYIIDILTLLCFKWILTRPAVIKMPEITMKELIFSMHLDFIAFYLQNCLIKRFSLNKLRTGSKSLVCLSINHVLHEHVINYPIIKTFIGFDILSSCKL
jgi:predicted transcriptional regulator